MPFRYLRDPLFLACVLVYFLNRFLVRPHWEGGFVHDHLNDLIFVPFWVPIMLFAERKAGARTHDSPPLWFEILIPIIVITIVFEIVLPYQPGWEQIAVADPLDVVFYVFGGVLAAGFWRYRYRSRRVPSEEASQAANAQRAG